MLHDGVIGDVLVAKAWNVQKRRNIGRERPSSPPAGFDYDLWMGPAPMVPFQKNRHHYSWHWWYDFGTGDLGNDGVHEFDMARWGLGLDVHPTQVAVAGGKFFFDDDQEFPRHGHRDLRLSGQGRSRRPQAVGLRDEDLVCQPSLRRGRRRRVPGHRRQDGLQPPPGCSSSGTRRTSASNNGRVSCREWT